MTANAFVNTQMKPGHRYAQRFETVTETICYQEDLDRKLTDFAKDHIVVSLTPYVNGNYINVIVGYLADLTDERIKIMCDDFLVTMANKNFREKKEPKTKEELRNEPEFIQFKTWCEDLVYWEEANGLVGKQLVVGGGKSFMPPLLNLLVEAKDVEKVEYYKTLFPEYAKKIQEAKKTYIGKKEESK